MSVTISWFKERGFQRVSDPSKPYALDIVGIRNIAQKDSNEFTDTLRCMWFDSLEIENIVLWSITTRPGVPWLLKPMQKKGTAILAPGQYLNSYKLGTHKGKEALIQTKPVKVYRDRNRDSFIDIDSDTIEEGLFGINIHRASSFSKLVGAWSAGCQVFQKDKDFEEFMEICNKSLDHWGNEFSYTLIEV